MFDKDGIFFCLLCKSLNFSILYFSKLINIGSLWVFWWVEGENSRIAQGWEAVSVRA